MTVQYSVRVRNARLDAIEATIGASPTLEFRTGAQPADCAAADSGTLLATLTLPADWMQAAASGAKSKLGTWTGTASAAGTAAHYRIKGGGACDEQGSCGMPGSGADLIIDNTNFAVGQAITVNTFTRTGGNP